MGCCRSNLSAHLEVTMSAPSIAPLLPFRRVRVVSQRIQADPAQAVVELAPDERFTPRCSRCRSRASGVHSRYRRMVRDLSLGAHRAWLWIPVRRVQCPSCEGIRAEDFEFVEPYARVTKRLARYIAALCRVLSVADVARHLGLDWKLVKACDKAVLTAEFAETDPAGLRLLAVDEIALLKGYHYMTVVLDYESGRVVWMGEGRRAETLGAFFALMSTEERAAVEAVALDMWAPYIQAVRRWLPNARVIYDLYHVVADYHRRVLDKVRVAAYRQANTEEERRWIKGSRYLLFKNEHRLTDHQRPRLERLLEVNEEIATAYILRDALKKIWTLRSPWAVRRALNAWCQMAEKSGIGPLRRFAGTLRRHRRGIVAHARYPIHTGRLEGVNNKIKVIKRRSYGFRDPDYFTLKVKQAFPGQ